MSPDGQSWHCQCSARRPWIALGPSLQVLPRYGFDGSEYGVAQMLEAFERSEWEPFGSCCEAIQPLLARDLRLVEQSEVGLTLVSLVAWREAIRQKLRVQLMQARPLALAHDDEVEAAEEA